MKLKVKINDKYKVTDIERDKSPDFIEAYKSSNNKLPSLPPILLPLVNGYVPGEPITKDIQVIPISGQQWQSLTSGERNQLLELVEWLGQDAGDYVRSFEIMYPKDPDFSKRK